MKINAGFRAVLEVLVTAAAFWAVMSAFGLEVVARQEKITLSAPISPPATSEWSVEDVYFSRASPAIKATLVSNAGERFAYRYVPSDTVTAAQVLAAINYVNQGKFKTVDNQTLQCWLLTQISAQGVKVGSVSCQ